MNEKDELREHTFDGIQEYDNDLPRWWVWLFALTIVIAAAYPFIYDFGPGEFASETVDAEVAAVQQKLQSVTAAATGDENTLLTLASNPAALSVGKEIFTTRCLACHGDRGQGLVGPNLTDEHWIHGGKITDIHHTVVDGVTEKGMIAWKTQLTSDQIDSVVAFVWSIYASNPPNPKAPEGEKVIREPK